MGKKTISRDETISTYADGQDESTPVTGTGDTETGTTETPDQNPGGEQTGTDVDNTGQGTDTGDTGVTDPGQTDTGEGAGGEQTEQPSQGENTGGTGGTDKEPEQGTGEGSGTVKGGGEEQPTDPDINKPDAPVLKTENLEVAAKTNLPLTFELPENCSVKVTIIGNKGSIYTVADRPNTVIYTSHSPLNNEEVDLIAYSVSADGEESDPLQFTILVKKALTIGITIDSETGNDTPGEDDDEPTVENAGLKLPYTEIELAAGDSKTISIISSRADYNFEDVTSIELIDYIGNAISLTKVSSSSFKITAEAPTIDPETIKILIKSTDNLFTTLDLVVTVYSADQWIAADFSKDVIDICPGNEVPFTLKGVDANTVLFEQGNLVPDSPLTIDVNKRTITCLKEGNFTQAVTIKKGNLTRVIYLQAISANIISVDPTDLAMNTIQTGKVTVRLKGLDYTVTVSDPTLIDFDKDQGVVTPLRAGSGTITFTGTRGTLVQEATVKVVIRDAINATVPSLQNDTTVVNGGENIYLTFDIGRNGDTLTVRADEKIGKVVVDGNTVVYTAFQPDEETDVKLYVRTTSVDGLESEEVEVTVTVRGVPDTELIVPESVKVTENETETLEIKTNATSLSLVSSVPEFVKVNSTKRTITGIKYGEAIITVTAQAVNHKPVTKEIKVTIEPAKVNKPVLTTPLRSVTEGKQLEMKFILDKDTTLVANEVSGEGTVEVNENTVLWTAPLITEEERQTYTLEFYAVRNLINTKSDKLSITVVVLKAKDTDPDQPDEPIDDSEKLSYTDLETALRSDSLTFEDKVALTKTRGPSLAVTTLTRLLSYEKVMNSSNRSLTSADGAAKNYELYMTIRTVLELTENDKFQALFTLVNLVFKQYADDAFSAIRLNRFDREWTGGDRNKYSFQNMTTLLTMLCDVMKRASNLNRIDFSIVFDFEKTVFTERVRESVIKYYTL